MALEKTDDWRHSKLAPRRGSADDPINHREALGKFKVRCKCQMLIKYSTQPARCSEPRGLLLINVRFDPRHAQDRLGGHSENPPLTSFITSSCIPGEPSLLPDTCNPVFLMSRDARQTWATPAD